MRSGPPGSASHGGVFGVQPWHEAIDSNVNKWKGTCSGSMNCVRVHKMVVPMNYSNGLISHLLMKQTMDT